MTSDNPELLDNAAHDYTKMRVQDMMKLYYGRLFPHQEMYKWLSYGNDTKHPQSDASFFQRREICFTLDGDIFVRYQSFRDGTEMQAAIRERCPAKIDIGPVYTVDPQRRAAYAAQGGFVPVERELVFDIDLTDYDDVRTCGKEGHICIKCWPLMAAAIAILDRGLREDFGFQHVLFVFSGRRGVHCWVCDERARRLTDEQRAAVATYFAVYKGQEKGIAKLATTMESHPAVLRAYDVLQEAFESHILPDQMLLEDAQHMEAMLQYVPSEALKAEARRVWASGRSRETGNGVSVDRWHRLKELVMEEANALRKSSKSSKSENARAARALENCLRDIVFAYTYPRLDMEVSKKMNHLLKAPFCVHPKTGKVCVPIDPEKAWSFDPENVCTVGGLLNELSVGEATSDDADDDAVEKRSELSKEGWRNTEMKKAVDTFQRCFLNGLQSDVKKSLAAKVRDAGAAQTLAW